MTSIDELHLHIPSLNKDPNVFLAELSTIVQNQEDSISSLTQNVEKKKKSLQYALSERRMPSFIHEQKEGSSEDESCAQSVLSNISSEYKRPIGRRRKRISPIHQTISSPNQEKVSFLEIYDILQSVYNHDESIQSTTLDIVGVYLKGQKILYIEAKTYCEQHLYALMLPAILISAICSVISVTLDTYNFGSTLVASLTALNSFILTLITYLKLDAKAEAHKSTAYAFEKLQSFCEFNSGKILFSESREVRTDTSTAIKVDHIGVLNHIEEKVREIKERNQFLLPEAIRFKYPILFSTNVFSEVKKIQNQEIILMNKLKVAVNLLRRSEYSFQKAETSQKELAQIEVDKYDDAQQTILESIIRFRNKYLDIDKMFKDEIENNIQLTKRTLRCCVWLKT